MTSSRKFNYLKYVCFLKVKVLMWKAAPLNVSRLARQRNWIVEKKGKTIDFTCWGQEQKENANEYDDHPRKIFKYFRKFKEWRYRWICWWMARATSEDLFKNHFCTELEEIFEGIDILNSNQRIGITNAQLSDNLQGKPSTSWWNHSPCYSLTSP